MFVTKQKNLPEFNPNSTFHKTDRTFWNSSDAVEQLGCCGRVGSIRTRHLCSFWIGEFDNSTSSSRLPVTWRKGYVFQIFIPVQKEQYSFYILWLSEISVCFLSRDLLKSCNYHYTSCYGVSNLNAISTCKWAVIIMKPYLNLSKILTLSQNVSPW